MTGNDIHGTPCAGVIAARGNSGGALGIAPRCRILAVKIFHADNLASDARVADAIRYAALHADILSCSWSGPTSPDIELAIQDAGLDLKRLGAGFVVYPSRDQLIREKLEDSMGSCAAFMIKSPQYAYQQFRRYVVGHTIRLYRE